MVATLATAALSTAAAAAAAVGVTPPMGWNPYNHYGCGGTEQELRTQASALLLMGLDKAGFRYINLDCGWANASRGSEGQIVPDPRRWPNGIQPFSDWVHAQGLLLGIYTDIGNKTCGGGAGILGHEEADAAQYAEWKVDLVKNDDCHHAANCTAAYAATWAAIVKSGRPMVHMTKSSLDIDVAPQFAQARRVSKDITWLFERVMSLVYQQQSWNQNLANRSGLQPSGNGFWNDMDSACIIVPPVASHLTDLALQPLHVGHTDSHTVCTVMEIGNAGVGPNQGIWQNLSVAESRTHFALWSILKSPMLLGCDLRAQIPEVITILTNAEATAFNQVPKTSPIKLLIFRDHPCGMDTELSGFGVSYLFYVAG